MGTFVFKWEHPAEEVHVTGTFDDWTKSVKLEKVGDVFEKEVELPPVSEKIYYKFVVDNNWVINQSAPQELDPSNNVNNVLQPAEIKPKSEAVIMSSVAPDATTVGLAAEVPLEEKPQSEKPEEKTEELNEKKEEPVATPSDIPGGYPVTPAAELEKIVSVNPLPATEGAVNPINIAPGEPLPPAIAGDSIHQHVKLDQESYEKADALPGLEGLPPVSDTMIPESSLPIIQNAISSVHPGATTVQLASDVPLEPKVPAVVTESQEKAHVDPEASAVPEEVKEKAAVEHELLEKVAPAPSTSEGTAGIGTEKTEDSTAVGATAATAGGAILASAIVAKDTIVEAATAAAATAVDKLPEPVKAAIIPETTKEEKIEEISPEVPAEVKESIVESGKAPEAAANAEAVEAKKEVEAELLTEVKPTEIVEAKKEVEAELLTEVKPTEVVEAKKEVEAELLKEVKPTEVVEAKKEVEAELLKEVKPVEEPKPVEEAPKPVEEPKTTEEAPKPAEEPKTTEEASKPAEALAANGANGTHDANGTHAANGANGANGADKSLDVTAEQHTGETASSVPSKSSSSLERKKKNRFSAFFGKIKSKFIGGGSEPPKQTTA